MKRRLTGTRELRSGEGGFTMVELVAAIAILSIGFVALTGAFAASTRLLIQSKQRRVATEQANAALEHVRNVPYAQVGLTTAPVHSSDPKNPDYYVNGAGTAYDHAHSGTYEDLETGGTISHTDGPTTIGSTSITTYSYVTWVDDPVGGSTAHDYKRITVVASFSAASNPGRKNTLQVSALLTVDTVTIGGTGTTPQGGSSPTPSATPTPTPTSSCSGDTTPPSGSFTIVSGTGATTGYTNSTSAQLNLAPSDPCAPIQAQLSNDNVTFAAWFTYAAASQPSSWTIPAGDGTKQIWARYQDGVGNQSVAVSQSIVLDQTKPTVPGTLAITAVSCPSGGGNNRYVTLSWGSSTDTNFLGYRVYKQINNQGFTPITTTSQTSWQDTSGSKNNDADFKVVGYDKAGNEGVATNVVSVAKNRCS